MEFRQKLAPCLWFEDQAEEAAGFYTGIFNNSRIVKITRYGNAGQEIHHMAPGSVMTVAFEIEGQSFTALNGGPVFHFNEAVSFQIVCDSQQELDFYWDKLTSGGDPKAQQCGWLKDKYGLSWQVVPAILPDMLEDPESPKSQSAFEVMMKMKKIDIAQLEKAYNG